MKWLWLRGRMQWRAILFHWSVGCCCLCCCEIVVTLKSGMVIPPALLILFRIVLTIWAGEDASVLPYEFCGFCLFLWKTELDIWWDCIESIDWFWKNSHFSNINCSSPWAQAVFPSPSIFFELFVKYFKISLVAGQTAQQLIALATLIEDQDSLPSTYIASKNCQ